MRKILLLFFFMMFMIGTDTFLVAPLLPKLKVLFHVPTAVSGWMVGAYALGYALFALAIGPLSDRWNRKKLMVLGLIGFAVSTALCGVATGFWTMVTFRFLAGVSAAIASPQVWASISILLPQDQVVKGMGIATAGLAVAQAFGVPIGSSLAAVYWAVPFYVIASFALALAVVAWLSLPDMEPKAHSLQGQGSILRSYRTYGELFRSSQAMWLFLAYFLFQFGNFGRFSFIGTWLNDRFDLSLTSIGLVMMWFGLGNMLGSFIGSRIIRRFGQMPTLLGGLTFVTLLSVILPILTQPAWIDVTWMATSFTFGTIFPIMMYKLQMLSPTARGTIASLSSALMYAGSTIGSALCGLLYSGSGGFTAVSIFTFGCFAASLVIYAVRHAMSHYGAAAPSLAKPQ